MPTQTADGIFADTNVWVNAAVNSSACAAAAFAS